MATRESATSFALAEAQQIRCRAVFLGQRVDTSTLAPRRSPSPLAIERLNGWVIVFRYGVAVLFGLDDDAEQLVLDELAPLVQRPYDRPEQERIEVRVDQAAREGISAEMIVVPALNVDRLQVIAEILAKSVALARYEEEVADAFGSIEPLATELQHTGHSARRTAALMRQIGSTLRIQHQMVGRIEVLEKPELLWENPEYERLYTRLAIQYELRDRHLALERKLELVENTIGAVVELVRAKRSLRVEWYIVILILVEIVLTLYELFVRH